MKKLLFLSLISIILFKHAHALDRIGVMTFNVENLFDLKHDKGKSDYAFLPLATKKAIKNIKKICRKISFKEKWYRECMDLDWNSKVLGAKLKALSGAVLQVNNGRGPDVLILQEVENLNILEQWRIKYLAKAKYRKSYFIEGNDRRGIDTAILSRLELAKPAKLHSIPFKKLTKKQKGDSRGILQADLKLPDGAILTVFANHFPAPFHSTSVRIQGFQELNKLQRKFATDHYSLAAGDFNVTKAEAAKTKILEKYVEKNWVLAHKVACKECLGTNYYSRKNSWSFLDMILLSKNLLTKNKKAWRLDLKSVRLANKFKEQIKANGTPKRFNPITLGGVSDHWPLYLELVKN